MAYPPREPTHEHASTQTIHRTQYSVNKAGIYARRMNRNGRWSTWSSVMISREHFDGMVERGSIIPISQEK